MSSHDGGRWSSWSRLARLVEVKEEVSRGRGSRAFGFVFDVITEVCLLRKWKRQFVFPTSNEKCLTLHCTAIQYAQVGVASLFYFSAYIPIIINITSISGAVRADGVHRDR